MDEASNGVSNDSDVVLIPSKPMTPTKQQLQQQDQQLLSGSSGLINPDSQSSDDKKKKNTRVRVTLKVHLKQH